MVLSHPASRYLLWWLIFLSALFPLIFLSYRIVSNQLGSDPVLTVVHFSGEWALRFLWLTLLITPLRTWFRLRWPGRFRRMLGLYTLFYASLHLLTFIALILEWQWQRLADELIERPYITLGAAAYILMLPLGVTSIKVLMKKMGRYWRLLHRLIYVIAVLALIHFFWQVRSDYGEVVIYAGLLLLLFFFRLVKPLPQLGFRS